MFAVNEVVNGFSSIAAGDFLIIQPPAGQQWNIKNLYGGFGNTIELYRTNGLVDILIDSSAEGGWAGMNFFATNDQYFKLKNTSASSLYLSFDGLRWI